MTPYPSKDGPPEVEREPEREPDEETGPPIEFQPESGALAPVDPIDEAQRNRDPRDDL